MKDFKMTSNTTMPTTARSRPNRRGGTLIEAAIILPVIISLAMGSVQYGYAFYVKHALQQAASAGCRVAAMPGSTNTSVSTAVTNHLTAAGFSSLNATVTTTPSSLTGVSQGTYVTVTVTASWSNVNVNTLPQGMGGFSPTRTFSGSMTLLHE
jgi:Flp pilus assembly protein TadG